jgi:rhamnogalacturonyl hydrolase YesR
MSAAVLAAAGLSMILGSVAFAAVPGVGDVIDFRAMNGKVVSANNAGEKLTANYFAAGSEYEKFLVVDAGGGLVALMCMGNGLYVSAVSNGVSPLAAASSTIGQWEKFAVNPSSSDPSKIAFLCNGNSLYVISPGIGDEPLLAGSTTPEAPGSYAWEVTSMPSGSPRDFLNGIPTNLIPEVIGYAASSNLLGRGYMWSAGSLHYAETYAASAAMSFARVTENTNLLKGLIARYFSPTRPWTDGVTIPTTLMDDNTLFLYNNGLPPDRVSKHRTPFILLEAYESSGDTNYFNKALDRSKDTRDWMAKYYPDPYPNPYDADSMFLNPVVESLFYHLPVTDTQERSNCVERAVTWVNVSIDTLQRADGLFQHNPLQGATNIWGRGAGWCHMALVECLMITPETHPSREKIYRSYLKFMDAMLEHQLADGMWYQLINIPGTVVTNGFRNWEESSGTAMICHSFARGIKQGWLDAHVYGPAVSKAWLALATQVDRNGNMTNVCKGLSESRVVSEGIPYYFDPARKGVGDLHGQAMLIWLASELIDCDFNHWALDHGLLGTNAFMAGNADGDAQNNFQEYAFGGNPTNPAVQGWPTAHSLHNSGGSNWIEYAYPRRTGRDSGLSYQIQTTANLTGGIWTNINPVVGGTVSLDDNYEEITVRIGIAWEARQFFRLKVQRDDSSQ